MPKRAAGPLRLAVLMALRPRKLGSLEAWMLSLARAAHERGHHVAFFGRPPIHPSLEAALKAEAVRFYHLEEIERHPLQGARRLARDYDVIHLNLFAPRDRAALVASAAWPARVLFVDHISGPARGDAARGVLKRGLDRLCFVRVAGVAGVSNYVRDRACARFRRADTRTIYNGVDVFRFRPPEARKPASPIRILAVANLIPEKGVEHLLRAVARLPARAAHTSIVGDGPEAVHLQRCAEDLGVAGRTAFLGLRDDVAELLRDTDVFVHPATWAEAFGLTIVEAMATGCAVIASRIGAIPELVEDGTSGLLVPPGDDVALANALTALLEDPAARARIGRAARQRAVEHFSLTDCVGRHLDWCEGIG